MEFNISTDIGGRTLNIQSGKLAKQASGASLVQYGETVVMVTVVSENERKDSDFLPLSVEYQEKIYAAGRIPGNYFRREVGRPSEKEILTSRLIDRPIRPLFPKEYRYNTQIIATVLSMDYENDPDILAMLGTFSALTVSDVPFNGPIASARVGRIGGKFVINPLISELESSDINIVVVASKTGIVMVEGGGNVVSEDDILEAVFFGHESIQPLIEVQEKLRSNVGKTKKIVIDPEKESKEDLLEVLNKIANDRLYQAMSIESKVSRKAALNSAKNQIFAELDEQWDNSEKLVSNILDDMTKKICRDMILKENRRIDNRLFDQVRPISCETGVLPRPHGSALFTRGETQVLGVVTLGSGQDEQRVETLNGEEHRSFMLHYNFPPFSVGEVKRVGAPSRRDIGHGGLSSRALEKVIPEKESFDYTIRAVSEVLESNGSSSMGTVCATTMALMDGGIPIKAPVSGIAMGLIKEEDKVVILTDILGDEDHAGDMDFKVAGTADGITALQMDIKIPELSKDVMKKALEQAKVGRLEILDKMLMVIDSPRKQISSYAPRIIAMTVSPDKIRDVIGPGGKVIRALQVSTNTKIEIADDGLIKITANSYDEADSAKREIEALTVEPETGKIYLGKVVKITDFGAFVQILPNVDGLVHISQLANGRVGKVSDVVKSGDEIHVKVMEITGDGKIRLSKKAVSEKMVKQMKK